MAVGRRGCVYLDFINIIYYFNFSKVKFVIFSNSFDEPLRFPNNIFQYWCPHRVCFDHMHEHRVVLLLHYNTIILLDCDVSTLQMTYSVYAVGMRETPPCTHSVKVPMYWQSDDTDVGTNAISLLFDGFRCAVCSYPLELG